MATDIRRVTVVPKLPPRQQDSFKNKYGHILTVGGSRGMAGALSLMTNAALRGGAGLVTFATPETVQPMVVPICPCATSIPLSCDAQGQLTPDSVRQMLSGVRHDVIAMGPGMGPGVGVQNMVRAALGQDKPLVLDADGLTHLAAMDNWATQRCCPMVLTPHPGEFSRLIGRSTKDVQAAREDLAVAACRGWLAAGKEDLPLVLVLKGAGTIVTDGLRVYVNDTGNAGMATGGSGDVLTGLLAAVIGQGLTPFDAACLAVHAHGRAGDLAAGHLGQVSMIASDLLDFLPQAMREAVGQ